ncbi:MAG: hypothetical protein JSW07_01605 [bacterium]|nr:MAG: hypothetical protein JSW07_01605 [bacterium]
MLLLIRHLFILLIGILCLSCSSISHISKQSTKTTQTFSDRPIPLLRAHSHNDYQHDRLLFDALDYGFTSIEVDIHLIDKKLLVAHDKEDVDSNRTLQSLYLDPLRQIVRRNGG